MAGPIDGNRGIGPRGPQGPRGPEGPGESSGPHKAEPKKDFVVPPQPPPTKDVAGRIQRNFTAVRNKIRDGLQRGLSKEQILHELTRDELVDEYGPDVPEGMVASVAKAVTEEPSLSQIFGKLFEKAGAE